MHNRKWILSVLLFFFSVASFATDAPDSPKKIIFDFYQKYFLYLHGEGKKTQPELTYSKSFNELLRRNEKLCEPYRDEVCGWGTDADVYLNAQDQDDNLTIENSHFTLNEAPNNVVTVSFNLFPSQKTEQNGHSVISFKMIYEQSHWVVDDIIYDESSARQQMRSENELLTEGLKNKARP